MQFFSDVGERCCLSAWCKANYSYDCGDCSCNFDYETVSVFISKSDKRTVIYSQESWNFVELPRFFDLSNRDEFDEIISIIGRTIKNQIFL
jgi:hypothetical protein